MFNNHAMLITVVSTYIVIVMIYTVIGLSNKEDFSYGRRRSPLQGERNTEALPGARDVLMT